MDMRFAFTFAKRPAQLTAGVAAFRAKQHS